jgi:inosine-uridine nucleoside N-ribohydrolase
MMNRIGIGKIPVILDTDIGSDIDDVWALAMMLNSQELDVKLIVTEHGNTEYRAKIAAKFLEACGRTDIPVGMGIKSSDQIEAQGRWVAEYNLDGYPGTVYRDGIGAMIDVIMKSSIPITLISLGPVTNLAEALVREPAIAYRTRFVGMQGSVRRGYLGSLKTSSEYNVAVNPKACQKVFSAPWDMTITPVDTCGLVRLSGVRYRKVQQCSSSIIRALMENYRIWDEEYKGDKHSQGYAIESTILYDTVAVYLAFSEEMLHLEKLGIRVTDDGYTVIDNNAKSIRCATLWKNLDDFEDMLVGRLIS